MGVFARITKVFGANGPHGAGGASAERNGKHSGGTGVLEGPGDPEEATSFEDSLGSDSLAGDASESWMGEHTPEDTKRTGEAEIAPMPKSKQELLAELRKNYSEAVSLIRKMDEHLDRQEPRSQRLVDLAERMPHGLDSLEQIRAANEELTGSVRDLTTVIKQGVGAAERDRLEQRNLLSKIESAVDRSVTTGREITGVVGQFNETMSGVADRVGEAAEAMARLEQRSSARLDDIEREVKGSKRWTIGIAALFALTVIGLVAMSLGTLVMIRGG